VREREREWRTSEPIYSLITDGDGCTPCTCAYACIHPPSHPTLNVRANTYAPIDTRGYHFFSLSLSLSLYLSFSLSLSGRTHTCMYTHKRARATYPHSYTHTLPRAAVIVEKRDPVVSALFAPRAAPTENLLHSREEHARETRTTESER